jgi:hypothetical protein
VVDVKFGKLLLSVQRVDSGTFGFSSRVQKKKGHFGFAGNFLENYEGLPKMFGGKDPNLGG